MPMGILYWFLVILWFLSVVFGATIGPWAVHASNGLLLVLFILLGWRVFGPPLQ